MSFLEAVGRRQTMVMEGSVYDRVSRSHGSLFDPRISYTGLLFPEQGRAALADAYREYLRVGATVLLTPTWRADQWRCSESGREVADVNREAVSFMRTLGSSFSLGGLLGTRNDCYKPSEALSLEEACEFHAPQAVALADAGVDFLLAATVPAMSEALGLASVMAGTGSPWALSFVADASGCVLDGTPLADAFDAVDQHCRGLGANPAFGYFVNCVHPAVLGVGYLGPRFVGFQGNASRRDPREFDGLIELDSDDPEVYAQECLDLMKRTGVFMVGGCCGTGPEHIQALASIAR